MTAKEEYIYIFFLAAEYFIFYQYHIFIIYSIVGHVSWLHSLAIINNEVVNMATQWKFFDICPEVEELDQIIVLLLFFLF